jgi:hypothetical protein
LNSDYSDRLLGDHLTVVDEALAAYERALEPKKLVSSPEVTSMPTWKISSSLRPLLETGS